MKVAPATVPHPLATGPVEELETRHLLQPLCAGTANSWAFEFCLAMASGSGQGWELNVVLVKWQSGPRTCGTGPATTSILDVKGSNCICWVF